jgi:hypothetical protein
MVWINQNNKNQYMGLSDGVDTPFDYVDSFSTIISLKEMDDRGVREGTSSYQLPK